MAEHNVSGSRAEGEVADYLKKKGYKIIDTNWQTKWCEVDVIARKDKTIHFVEVKYRRSDSQGSGFDYITKPKLRKMRLAANSWVEINSWRGQYVLSAAEVSGSAFSVVFISEV